jgi:adenylylsulfate kinase
MGENCNNEKGFCLWFTGLSGAGKSTITDIITPELKSRGVKFEVFDGDVVRTNLSKGLTFSKEDRDINIRRIGFVCDLLTRNGVCAIGAAISPYSSVRDENRKLIESNGGVFIEVHISTPLEECEKRDTKGLYKKARAGEIKGFTGIDDPYEAPSSPEIDIKTEGEDAQASAARIIAYLEANNLIPVVTKSCGCSCGCSK